eukprot:CAMPEP_0183721102 /NCGR_PEP_ID=MMETSP0737-20130205/13510_1 /TAXON_ID=385413 /ORGANISM="Thalassiosira miniscula, Strain CCMP1093" /LENGTH=194 /DNA_ID=CAMNT_0025951073 /DNA_START=38 /DNA_END=622 /DNA_ORIENTATION=-
MKSASILPLLIHAIMLLSTTSFVKSFTLQSIARGGGRTYSRCSAGIAIGGRTTFGPSSPSLSTLSLTSSSSFHAANTSPSSFSQRMPQLNVGYGYYYQNTQRWMTTGDEEDETSIVEICRGKIAVALETEDVKVIGAYDDPNGSHISIEVTSELFEGKRPVQRQQLVYKALWEELQGAVHAVDSMVCKTPAEKK